jgi:hypothetical protein
VIFKQEKCELVLTGFYVVCEEGKQLKGKINVDLAVCGTTGPLSSRLRHARSWIHGHE